MSDMAKATMPSKTPAKDKITNYSKDIYMKAIDEILSVNPQGYGFNNLEAIQAKQAKECSRPEQQNAQVDKTQVEGRSHKSEPNPLIQDLTVNTPVKSCHKDNSFNMNNKENSNSPWGSDAAEVAAALGLSADVVAKGMGVKATTSNSSATTASTSGTNGQRKSPSLSKDGSSKNSKTSAHKSATIQHSGSDLEHDRSFLSIEIMRELGSVVSEENYKTYCARMKKHGLEPYSQDLLVAMMVCSFFSKDGTLAQKLSNYNPRTGQMKFADSVVRAMAKNDVLIVEAGTGTGKTYSYLVPPLLADKKIVVSTKTKALQDQLISKDIPNLLSMMDLEHLHAISLKGQSNYICRYLFDGDGKINMSSKARDVYTTISDKIEESSNSIDRDIRNATFGEINFKVPEKFRRYVSCDSNLCREMSSSCPYAAQKREHLKKVTEAVDKLKDEKGDVNYVMRNFNKFNMPNISSEHCFTFASRQEAKQRDITVINHALFFAALQSDSGIGSIGSSLPLPDILIFDEAHTLAEVGCEFYKTEFTASMVIDLIDKIRTIFPKGGDSGQLNCYLAKLGYAAFLLFLALSLMSEGRYGVSAIKYLHNKTQSPFQLLQYRLADIRARQALMDDSYYMAVVEKGLKEHNAKLYGDDESEPSADLKKGKESQLLSEDELPFETTEQDKQSAKQEDATLAALSEEELKKELRRQKRQNTNQDHSIESFVKLEYQRLALDLQKKLGPASLYSSKNDVSDELLDAIKDINGLPVIDSYFRALMGDIHKALSKLSSIWEKNKEIIAEDYNLIQERIDSYKNFVADFMTTDRNKNQEECFKNAGWVEIGKEDAPPKLVVCPIDIGDRFYSAIDDLKKKGVTVVLTSATITFDKSFGKFCHELGLPIEQITTQIVESPFNYAKNACLYLSKTFPDVYSKNFVSDSLYMIDELIRKATGGIFMLCTSFNNMKLAKEVLEKRYGSSRTILMQTEDTVPNLINQFKKDGKAILIGTSSFWEGVDVAGNALSLVIIDKLPFKQVGDPIQIARKNRVERLEKGNFFNQVQVPEATIALRQGVGRLIRNEDDQGVLVILDNRLLTKGYGPKCVNSLPPMTRVDSVKKALPFFKKV